jgi:hypothetical protein
VGLVGSGALGGVILRPSILAFTSYQRCIIAVIETGWVEPPRFFLYDVQRQFEHVVIRLCVRQVAERLLGGAHLIVEIERVCDQPGAMRADQHRAHAAEEHGASDSGDIARRHGVPDQCEGFGPGWRARRKIIWAIEIDVVDLAAGHKRLDI